MSVDAPPADATPAPAGDALPLRLKLTHGAGAIAYGVKDSGFSVFLLLFYNQVIGLDARAAGTAIMLALIVDAFIDPVIGQLSDATRSRWGRRLPWLYAAPLPLALAWLLLWHPPGGGSESAQLGWLFGMAVLVRMLVSMCEVPSVALVPELTRDYHERTLLLRYRFLFGWAGGLVLVVLAYAVFLRPTAGHPNGLTNIAGYGAFAAAGAALIAVSVIGSALGQHRAIVARLATQPMLAQSHGWRAIIATVKTPAFLWLLGGALFAFMAQGVNFALTNYLLGYVWQFDAGEISLYALVLFASVVIAFIIVAPLSRRLGKRDAAIIGGGWAMTINALLYAAYLLGWIAEGQPLPVYAMILAANAGTVITMILCSSMLTDVVEAAEVRTGRRAEGLFFAGFFFIQKCATGIGIFLAGQMLAGAGFPQNAEVGAVPEPVLDRLVLSYVVALVLIGLTAIAIIRRFPLGQQDHEARLATLSGTS